MAVRAQDAFLSVLARQEGPTHPQVSFLEGLARRNHRVTRVAFWRGPDLLRKDAPRLYLTIENSGTPQQQMMEWTPELEEYLFRKGVQAEDVDQEAERGAYLLLQNLRWADQKWGNRGHVDAALHGFLTGGFGNVEPIGELLSMIRAESPQGSEQLVECRDYVRDGIAGYANSLLSELKYEPEVASGILLLAITRMLVGRFSISGERSLLSIR